MASKDRKRQRLSLAVTDLERKAIRWAARRAHIKAPNGSRGDSLILWTKTVSDCVNEYTAWLKERAA